MIFNRKLNISTFNMADPLTYLQQLTRTGRIHYDFDSSVTQPSILWACAMADTLKQSSAVERPEMPRTDPPPHLLGQVLWYLLRGIPTLAPFDSFDSFFILALGFIAASVINGGSHKKKKIDSKTWRSPKHAEEEAKKLNSAHKLTKSIIVLLLRDTQNRLVCYPRWDLMQQFPL